MTEEIVGRRETAEKHQQLVLELYRQAQRAPMAWVSAVIVFHDTHDYEALGYPNFKAWCEVVGLSHSKVYGIMSRFKQLEEHIPAHEVCQIQACNAHWFDYLSENQRKDPAVWKAAQQMTEGHFNEFVRKRCHPQALPEHDTSLKLKASGRQALLDLFEYLKPIVGTDSREVIIDFIVAHIRNCPAIRAEADGDVEGGGTDE
jgi:hypothetical protein